MHLLFILTSIAYLRFCLSKYEYVCPTALSWRIRGKVLCIYDAKYSCLHDENKDTSTEICRETTSLLAPGNKYVIRGNIDGENCKEYRYQPFIFMTNQSDVCAFKKSYCKEEGQIIHSNGSTTKDTSCRCDYTKNYAPVRKPIHSCYCVPSNEDCSCYLKQCPYKTHLSPDYTCKSDYTLAEPDVCGQVELSESDKSGEQKIQFNIDTVKFQSKRDISLWMTASLSILAGLLLAVILVLLLGSDIAIVDQPVSKHNDVEVRKTGSDIAIVEQPVSKQNDVEVRKKGSDKAVSTRHNVGDTEKDSDDCIGDKAFLRRDNVEDKDKGSDMDIGEQVDSRQNDVADNEKGSEIEVLRRHKNADTEKGSDIDIGEQVDSRQNEVADNEKGSEIEVLRRHKNADTEKGSDMDIGEQVDSRQNDVADNEKDEVGASKNKQEITTTSDSNQAQEPLVNVLAANKKKYLEEETRILLIGKKGVGKSTIVKLMTGKDGGKTCTKAYTQFNNKTYFFVEKSGLPITGVSSEIKDNWKHELQTCIYKTSPGPHAVLFVMKLTDMYDHGDYEAFKSFLSYFSPEMRSYVIIVLTHHETLAKKKQNVYDYIKSHRGDLSELFSFFDYRKLVFTCNNKLEQTQTRACVKELFERIGALKDSNRDEPRSVYYKDDNFKWCEQNLDGLEYKFQSRSSATNPIERPKQYENEKIRIHFRKKIEEKVLSVIMLKELDNSIAMLLPKPKIPVSYGNKQAGNELPETHKETTC